MQIIKLIKEIKRSRLFSSFLFLSASQFTTLVIPLLITPFLIKVVGLHHFGVLVFSQSLMLFLAIIVDFGFNISGTREISINSHSQCSINKIYSTIMGAKVLLLLGCIILLIALLLLPMVAQYSKLYLYAFLIVIGQAFTPIWLYQGLDKLKFYSIVNITSKLLYALLVFVFIKSQRDFALVNLFFGASFLFTSLVCLTHTHFFLRLKLVRIEVKEIISELKASVLLFLSSLSINLYTYSNSIILGMFAGYEVVGLYGVAERVLNVLKQILILFSQVFYPAGCKAATASTQHYKRLLQKAYFPFFWGFILIVIIVFSFSPYIVLYFNHQPNETLNYIMRILIVASIFTLINIPAYQTLLSFNFKRSYSLVLIIGSILSIILNFILTAEYNIWGTAINVLITEAIIAAGLYLILHFKHRQYTLFNYVRG